MGFRVGQNEVKTRIIAMQDGERHTLVHIHREPTPSELKEYQRASAAAVIAEGADSRYGDAEEKLWDEIIISVEGYEDEHGNDVCGQECPHSEWKTLIPLTHKLAAINQIGSVWIPRRGEGKN